MNAFVASSLYYILINQYRWGGTQETHVGADVDMTPVERVTFANNMGASAFVSVHHNSPALSERSYVMYDTTSVQKPHSSGSQQFAQYTADGICAYFITNYPDITCSGACVDQAPTCGNERKYVLYQNPRWSIIGEACPTGGDAAPDLCNNTGGNQAAFNEAKGYESGLNARFKQTSVGTSFTAQGGPGVDTLRWVESDPNRSVVYVLSRSDACWGPFEYMDAILSQDTLYTHDNTNYKYIDRTVAYNRLYFYKLDVADEHVGAAATPTSLPAASPPGTPMTLQGTGQDRGGGVGTVSLTWNSGAGTATGYHVYRSRFVGMPTCDSTKEYLGVAPTTSFQDTTAPTGIQLFYRVRAFNSTGGSNVSNQANLMIVRVVGVEEAGAGLSPSLKVLGPNPGQVAAIRYSVPSNSNVRISIFDVTGRIVARLLNEERPRGVHNVFWAGLDSRGNRVASGVYFIRMELGDRTVPASRIVLLR